MIDLDLYRHLFARVDDAYGELLPTKGATAVREPVTDKLIQAHIRGDRHLGFYLIDNDGLVDRGYFDIDIPKKLFEDPATTPEMMEEAWKEARRKVRAIVAVLDRVGIEYYVASSRRRGYHVAIHATAPVQAPLIRRFLAAVVKSANVSGIECFPKQDKRGGDDGLGSFVFGMLYGASVPKKKTVVVDHTNGFDPMDSWEVLAGVKGNSMEALSSAIATLEEEAKPALPLVAATKEDGKLPLELIGIGFERCEALDRYKWNATEAGRLLPDDDPREHAARIALANYCRAFEGGEEWAVDAVFQHTEDYVPKETRKQIASLRGAPSRCDGEGLCPGGQCDAIKALGKQSPIALVYEVLRARKTPTVEMVSPPAEVQAPVVRIAPTPTPLRKGPLFVSVPTLLDNPRAPQWFVRGYIETPSTARIFGASGTGKSFLGADMALASAISGRWMGKRVTGGPVYYIAGEGHKGLQRRFQALQRHHGLERLPECLYLSTARIELNSAGSLEVEMEIERISKETNTSPALVVIDTLARAMPSGKDEDKTRDMGEFINEVDKIRDKLQCVAVIIHHTGNSETHRARGSSSMLAAVDAEMHVFMQGTARIAKWVKLKDQPLDPNGHEFTLRRVVLGEDETAEEGEEKTITSCVVEWGGEAAVQTIKPMTRAENLGLETLRQAITEGYSATLEAWRATFYEKHWGDNLHAKKTAFARVRESLVGKGLIRIDGEYYSIEKGPRNG